MKIITVLVIITAFLGNVPAVYAGHRIQDEAERGAQNIDLERTKAASGQARGTIAFDVRGRNDGQTRIDTKVRIRDLKSKGGRDYRVWLIDSFDDIDAPIKRFSTTTQGDADFTARVRLKDVGRFDKVVVSEDTGRESGSKGRGATVLKGEVALSED